MADQHWNAVDAVQRKGLGRTICRTLRLQEKNAPLQRKSTPSGWAWALGDGPTKEKEVGNARESKARQIGKYWTEVDRFKSLLGAALPSSHRLQETTWELRRTFQL